jgi:hypothetical protein
MSVEGHLFFIYFLLGGAIQKTMANEALWGEMLDVLKDIGAYLAKGDAEQEEAKLDKPPKISEGQKPIKGGEAPGFGPGKNALVQKNFPPMQQGAGAGGNEATSITSEEGTLLKEADIDDFREDGEDNYGEDAPEESSRRGDEEDGELELKSLLKDIRNALVMKAASESSPSKSKTKESSTKSSETVSKALVNEIVGEIKKSLPSIVSQESHRMLRKMGFSPSRSDIVRLGTDEDIKKSFDTGDEKVKEVNGLVEDMTKKSWQELGRMRENTGDFNPFR